MWRTPFPSIGCQRSLQEYLHLPLALSRSTPFNRAALGEQAPSLISEKQMSAAKQNPASSYQPIPFAKKHRISIEDAKAILEKHGADRKSADKEARRVSV
jgi:hypothetical protein